MDAESLDFWNFYLKCFIKATTHWASRPICLPPFFGKSVPAATWEAENLVTLLSTGYTRGAHMIHPEHTCHLPAPSSRLLVVFLAKSKSHTQQKKLIPNASFAKRSSRPSEITRNSQDSFLSLSTSSLPTACSLFPIPTTLPTKSWFCFLDCRKKQKM